MWLLISFAIIALVIFIIMTLLKVEPLISIVVSVLGGLILAYFFDHISITYYEDRRHKDHDKDNDNDKSNDKNVTIQRTQNDRSETDHNYSFFRYEH
jgi:hypothetical protein